VKGEGITKIVIIASLSKSKRRKVEALKGFKNNKKRAEALKEPEMTKPHQSLSRP